MIDNTLQEKLLEASYIIHDFVNDEPKCNYERYLTELINHSAVFMRKSKGTIFQWVETQNHGECDAVSEYYSVDFKLLATRSTLQGLRETSYSITKIIDGGYAFGGGRWPAGQEFTYIRTVAALRKYTNDELIRIADKPVGDIEPEISIILKSLRKKKNLLLFYPYVMLFSEPHTFEKGCNSIAEAFNEDLQRILVYRRRESPTYDTFLCTVYEDKLLVFEDIDGIWILEDFVEMSSSKIYMDLYNTYGSGRF